MRKRPIIFSSTIAMIFTALYVWISNKLILNQIEKKYPGELFEVNIDDFWNNNAQNYLWKLMKLDFLIFAIVVCLISVVTTFLFWKKERGFRTVGLYFLCFSVYTVVNGFFYNGFKVYYLFLLMIFLIPFVIGIIRKEERLTFVSGLFTAGSIVIYIYCYLMELVS
jgi:hypothetical protein